MEKSAPTLRFSDFEEEWKLNKLDNLLHFKNGINASKEHYGKGYKFINVLDIIQNDFITNERIIGSVSVSEDIFKKNIVEYGDILFQRSSETREEVGQSNVYLDKSQNATFGGFIIRGKKIGEYDPYFMHLLLKSSSARKEITSKSGGSTRYNVGQSTLSSVQLYFPNKIEEQQKIASFLTAVDTKINQLTKRKALLEQYKKGVMQKIFSQEIRFKDDNGNDYPEWEERRLGEVATINMGQSPESSSYNSEGIGYYLIQGNADISNRKTTPRNFTSKPTKLCDIGDLILTVRAPVGAVAKSNHKACIGRGVCSIKNKTISSIEFIYHFLLGYEKRWTRLEQGSTFSAVSGKDIKSIEIKLPSIREQTKIADFLSALDNKVETVTTQIENTTIFKKGLLQQMFV
tara:strand:+ start:9112 stop:10320 length:1209 start_codon:yes stop_codon:yes gene_type:complete